LIKYLQEIYGIDSSYVYDEIEKLKLKYNSNETLKELDEKDIMLITYGDSIKGKDKPLKLLNKFLSENVGDLINTVHILPMFPYSSDDGFSVVNYLKIDKKLGSWEDIKTLSKSYKLMFDAVINHISASSDWFIGYCNDEEEYKNFFIECFDNIDYKDVVRPRNLPLYYRYKTRSGDKNLWATFSSDQLDLNYSNPKVFIKVLEVLLEYAKNGANFIRLDAVGFLWKEVGTSCIHHRKTHLLIKIIREVLESCFPNTRLITETNVPHKDNISYFGNGDEAHLVYQFPLPPLTLFTFISGNSSKITNWAKSLEKIKLFNNNTYFNFLASHDGIGIRPVEDILDEDEIALMLNNTINKNGRIGYKKNSDGTKSPYELNINYLDAIADKNASVDMKVNKFMASQFILLSLQGVPGIYIHSLLGSQNDYKGLEESNINRRINREKLNYDDLINRLNNKDTISSKVFSKYKELLKIRKDNASFSPSSKQKVLYLNNNVFALIRNNDADEILCIVNVTNKEVKVDIEFNGIDLITGKNFNNRLNPFQYCWVKRG